MGSLSQTGSDNFPRVSGRQELNFRKSHDCFVTTQWSVVRSAADGETATVREALEKLCGSYWYPLYAYVRRKGHDEHDAQDLTQEFFARLIQRNDFAGLDRGRGKFRAFLLAAMNHFLAKEWRKAGRLKRGAGQSPLSLDTTLAEQRYGAQPAVEPTPERLFDRRWAETVLERAAKQLREEFVQTGRETLFRELNAYLSAPAGTGDYAAVAQRLQMTESAVAKSVERLIRSDTPMVWLSCPGSAPPTRATNNPTASYTEHQ